MACSFVISNICDGGHVSNCIQLFVGILVLICSTYVRTIWTDTHTHTHSRKLLFIANGNSPMENTVYTRIVGSDVLSHIRHSCHRRCRSLHTQFHAVDFDAFACMQLYLNCFRVHSFFHFFFVSLVFIF